MQSGLRFFISLLFYIALSPPSVVSYFYDLCSYEGGQLRHFSFAVPKVMMSLRGITASCSIHFLSFVYFLCIFAGGGLVDWMMVHI